MFTPSNLLEEVASDSCKLFSTSVDVSAFLRHFAFWPRQIKASAKKKEPGAGRGRGGEAKKGNACPQKFVKCPFQHSSLGEFIA